LASFAWALPAPAPESLPAGRGSALVAARDERALPQGAWENLEYFLERVIPVAGEAGVRLACRASAPFLRETKRLLDLTPHGLDLCLGTLAELHADPETLLPELGDKLWMVHIRNPRGRHREAFLDEGELSLPRALLALKKAGFSGPLRAALPPGMVGDTPWRHKGRAFDLGYLRAILQVIERM